MNLQSRSPDLIHVWCYNLFSLCCSCTVRRNGFLKASRNFNQSDLDEEISRYATHTHTYDTQKFITRIPSLTRHTFLQKENALVTLQIVTSLTSQIHFHKRGKGLVNCVYKPCSTILYSAVQSRCSILSHDTLHHCLSSNTSLENDNRELGYLFRYCRNCKNTSTIFLG